MSLHILLVEDNPAHAKIILHGLRGLGRPHSIRHVTDGDLALDYVYGRGSYKDRQSYPAPELILLDLRLPRMDGFEVLQQIKSDRQTRSIPVIVMTSSDRREDRQRCEDYGAEVFMTKPVDFSDLFQWLDSLERQPRRHDLQETDA
ncbi:MAG: two-component system response regulator [Phycisphaerae bacterium]